ncbi:hypothetical protein NMY22_g3731 [Coprinellus aureogranulatus]|nr:hypothetical protein NMY22_g3731 [Coprinellus aureogranulatus]
MPATLNSFPLAQCYIAALYDDRQRARSSPIRMKAVLVHAVSCDSVPLGVPIKAGVTQTTESSHPTHSARWQPPLNTYNMTNNSSQGKKGQQLTRKTSSKEAVSDALTGKTPRSLAKQSSGSQLKRSTRSNPSIVKQDEACSQSEDDNMNVDMGSTQPESNGEALMEEQRNSLDPMDEMKAQFHYFAKE